MNRKAVLIGVVILVFATAVVSFWKKQGGNRVEPTRKKVFLIGFDGASWNLMAEPLRQGKLPNFKKLIDAGTSGPLKSFVPTKSPILWTTIGTGKQPAKHGIGSFTAQVNGKTVPVSGSQRVTKAFWNILSDHGVSVGVVNWWVTWPPEKVKGFMVSDRYRNSAKEGTTNTTYPPDLARHLPKVALPMKTYLEERKKFGLPENLRPVASSKSIDQLATDYKGYWAQDRAVRETCIRLMKQEGVDVFAVVFRIIDVSSHLFWTYLDLDLIAEMRTKLERGEFTESDAEKIDSEFLKIIGPVYEYSDQILGDFLRAAGPDAHYIVVSDHGFKFEEGRYGHSSMKEPPPGIIILSGPSFRKNHRIDDATLLDITPTLLYLQGVPSGKDMDGKILLPAFQPEFVKAHLPKTIASHESGPRKKGEAQESEMDQEILEDLRSLGYIQ